MFTCFWIFASGILSSISLASEPNMRERQAPGLSQRANEFLQNLDSLSAANLEIADYEVDTLEDQSMMEAEISRYLYNADEDQSMAERLSTLSTQPEMGNLYTISSHDHSRASHSSWFRNASQAQRDWVASIMAHYWGRRCRTIAKKSLILLEKKLTAEMGQALLNPSTPVEVVVQITDAFKPSFDDPYAVSVRDLKRYICQTYALSRKTLDRYVTIANMEGLEGASASVLYQYCTRRWNELNPDRYIAFGRYVPWQPDSSHHGHHPLT